MSTARTASLASVFQEVLTVMVRVRSRLQTVTDAEAFRSQIRQLLQNPMQQARTLGYPNRMIRSAVFAVVALLDESVLNIPDSVFAQWSRRPLQEELFGGHLAGETFFLNLRAYLAEPDSPHLADVLEVHCLCLLLGYRGRYALGDSGELFTMLRQARARIHRIRGDARIVTDAGLAVPSPLHRPVGGWNRSLYWTTIALASLLVIAFVAYYLFLASGAAAIHSSALNAS
jgi:type VI secretion system protein ImpK